MLYYMLGGFDEGLKDLAEKLAGAVNWAPSMGVLGGPELGIPSSELGIRCSLEKMYRTLRKSCVCESIP